MILTSKEFSRRSEKSGVTRKQLNSLVDDVCNYLLDEQEKDSEGIIQAVSISCQLTKAGK